LASLIYRCGFYRGVDGARTEPSAINSQHSQGNQSRHIASFVALNSILRCPRRVPFVFERALRSRRVMNVSIQFVCIAIPHSSGNFLNASRAIRHADWLIVAKSHA